MEHIPQEAIAAFISACHDVAARNLVRCSSGNMSRRLDNNRMLVTASRSWMERLGETDVTACQVSSGAVLHGNKPSVELGFHHGILRKYTNVNVVLHFQSPAATTVACMPTNNIDFNVIPEVPYYIGPVARIPFILPGSEELAAAVVGAMENHTLVILTNHGLVAVGAGYKQVIQIAEFFEFACGIFLRGNGGGSRIPHGDAQELLKLGESGAVPV